MKRKFSQPQQQGGHVRDLLVRGVGAAKAGDTEEARFYLEWVLIAGANEDQMMEAWLWLAEVSEGPEKRHYLEEILSRRPAHARARRMLALLDGRLKAEEIVDPEKLAERPAGAEASTTKARQFRCPQCSARLVFTPDGAGLHCEHCGYRQQPEKKGGVEETDFIVTMATTRGHLQPAATPVFSCRSCTASFLLPAGALTVTCPYCHHTYAVESGEMRELAPPQGLIPFAIDEAQATRIVQSWLTEHGLRPHSAPHGLYAPLWSFDVGGSVDWQGHLTNYEEDTRTWQMVSGSHPLLEDDIVVAACDTLPPSLRPLLQSYDLSHAVAFDEAYLAAWPAQMYEVAVGAASLLARKAAYERGKEEVRRSQERLRELRCSSAGIIVISHKLLLVPVWLAHYRMGDELLTLGVNGQNGRLLAQRTPRKGLFGGVRRWWERLGRS